MPDFSTRSTDIEIMDDLNCSGDVLEQTLRELEVINKWLGGNNITINAIDHLLTSYPRGKEVTIVDLGCGGGDMLRIIDRWARKNNYQVKLIGIDANSNIIDFAKKNLSDLPCVTFETLNIFSSEFQTKQYDIVIGTLFFHHFSNDELHTFFKQLQKQVSIGFVINDIHRHWFAYYAIKLLTQLFSKSPMVKYDAPLSVLRAFKADELKQILEMDSFSHYLIRWRWAFRWQVIAKVVS